MIKQEQIGLVALGYVIGFVSAFILFELLEEPKREIPRESNDYGLVATVYGDDNQISDVVIDNQGLFVKVGGRNRIVSAAALVSGSDAAGYHYAISNALISPDRQSLYYCAQASVEDDHCLSYVYRVSDDTTYKVKRDDEQMTEMVGAVEAMWTSDNRLSLGGGTSVPGTPWNIE